MSRVIVISACSFLISILTLVLGDRNPIWVRRVYY